MAVGCLVARYPEELRRDLPEVDYFVEKFTFAVDKCGGWEGDLKNLQAQRKGLEDMAGKLDALAARYELFPVETVGDAYMVVGNLPDPQPDHAARVAHFALHAVAAAESILVEPEDPASGSLGLRVGFHAGPCVASVMGRASPRYSLLG